ncbi:MAG TPA: HU family DNA-binding protein [Myxococcota bacterium]|nr:HU family DNA-binding protein [Myxococcota bacterium]HQE72564.1 HU family DNA-binding protein [Myxococcota bacterium]HQI60691.1 HU family DNA-binding protein [Myxococcota bacterium]
MTKAELIDEIRGAKGIDLTKKQTEQVVGAVFDTIREAIKRDQRFSYPGFGTFTVRTRKARKGRNPKNGQEITIPASNTVGFKPAPKLKNSLNG